MIFESILAHPFILLIISFFTLNYLLLKLRKKPSPCAYRGKLFTVPELKKLYVETDHEVRKARLKRKFDPKQLAPEYDAIVVGSGIGGMTCAGLMARAGKRVLVLEKIKIGGCTHTFKKKGFEFDVGVHYIGNIEHGSMNRFLLDFLTDGRLKWAEIDPMFDTVVVGDEKFNIAAGYEAAQQQLEKHFPNEKAAISRYFKLLKRLRSIARTFIVLKLLPMWIIKAIKLCGMHKAFFADYIKYSTCTLEEVVAEITEDRNLRAVMSYCFGDFGTIPSETPFLMQAVLVNHFVKRGGFYPIGGASEIAYNMIPGIEASGGAVMCAAHVTRILYDQKRKCVTGVMVNDTHEVKSHVVVSNAGIFNTFDRLLPANIVKELSIKDQYKNTRTATSFMQVFVGLKGTAEELDLPKKQFWVFTKPEIDQEARDYLKMDRFDAVNSDIPLLFVSFPSAKDRTYQDRYPGKSTCALVTFSNIEWFREWDDQPVRKRGNEYLDLKTSFGQQAWKQVLKLFPHLEDKVEYFEVGSPLTHKHYITAPNGEIYGIDHDMGRFEFDQASRLRPETSVEGLYLSGQDVFMCGFMGATFGGLMCASSVLDQNLVLQMTRMMPEYRQHIKDHSEMYED